MDRRTFLASLLASAAAVQGGAASAIAQPAAPGPSRPLPAVSWSCPMHSDVVLDGPGKCPQCSMPLVPVRLALVWSCPVHTAFAETAAGRCRVCGRELVRVIKSLTFTCRVHPKVTSLDPGNCPICKRVLVAQYSARAHGDHNPKHGGFFFMPSNDWHVELTHPSVSVFRLYVYDAYSKPLEPAVFAARIVSVPNGSGEASPVTIPFTRNATGGYHTARVQGLGLPAPITVKVRLSAHDEEYRLDTPFLEYSKEPSSAPATR